MDTFFFFPCLVALTRASSTVLNRNGEMDTFNSDLRNKRGVFLILVSPSRKWQRVWGFLFYSFCLHAEPMKGLRMQAEAVEILLKLVREGR